MDADLVTALGSTPTVTEKLYAEAIEDSRLRAAELNQYRSDIKAMMDWFRTEYTKLPAETISEADYVYQKCVFLGVEIRKQTMSTTTTRETVMQDVINDGVWIGEQLFNHFKAVKGKTW